MKIPNRIMDVPKTNPRIATSKKTLPGQFSNILRNLETIILLTIKLENHPENYINQDK
tara:strand:+ start:69 stop:242 length:174 start_codon:yes stop_codon:yes gene_type:complete